ncbi:MAG: dTDP-4-dehydrorhamnose 3,5-epimerase [Verrucomicrobia bacterium]|nr:dTDP-4-dehydrorhamnose 3,5-epimerase [Verrucomicrobiota bacterium]MCG2681955.1 dTDP-4-dehydrorhamnose 3,5-epimerase [Kiritimatiellia bacterium]MBU4247155.1 dTDP-4-dehydrorhamnose 3,5-epimerase [Verrucomicrobiota bacterium]MBU4290996.1 dTDP-4-dehydrorhamnose 3,5-epimerase [Verrucomicrobiota bacterium]MBU4429156.1 dTDP-4-dehydrorhamnose 3,5-epimerase [Verrucomicrobiota bacterium]
MKPKIIPTSIPDLVLLEIDYCRDERGFFIEAWHKRDFAAAGLAVEFVQENHSRSGKGVLRGMHYQDMAAPLIKLVRCTLGAIYDVAVDLRVGSPTFGRWFGVELSAENKWQIVVPIGFAHGFVALTEFVEIQYKQTNYYTPSSEGTLSWNDPEIGIQWPIRDPVLSKRDARAMSLRCYLQNPVFSYPVHEITGNTPKDKGVSSV